jgi:hypothetical protein
VGKSAATMCDRHFVALYRLFLSSATDDYVIKRALMQCGPK